MPQEYTVKNNDFTSFDNDPSLTLVKIDKNNSHHYISSVCRKCGGTGHLHEYEYYAGGTCFRCGGSGVEHKPYKIIVRTYEHSQKLAQARLERARKTAHDRNVKFLASQGFSENGETWVVMGNTFKIKDALKEAGAKFNEMFLWHFDHEVTEFPVVKVTINDTISYEDYDGNEFVGTLGWYADDGTLCFGKEYCIRGYIDSLRDKYELEHMPETRHYGEIGDKVEKTVKLIRYGCFDTQFGVTYIYTFESPEGYTFIWKTSKWLELESNTELTLKGTVKAFSEYKGIKQTQLTRCKIA